MRLSPKLKLPVAAVAIFTFIVIGILLLSRSNAATAFLSAEPENGALTGALKVSASDASGGAAVSFSAMSVVSVNDFTIGTGPNQFAYTGTWATDQTTAPGAYQANVHYSNTAGSYYTVQFSGTQIKVYSEKNNGIGIAGYSIDGGTETLVDGYAAARADQQLLYTSPALSDATHTLKVRVTGNKNASSGNTYVVADRVDITGQGGTVTPPPPPPPPPTPVPLGVGGTWTLKFQDEFNGTSLDTSRWSPTAWGGTINKVPVSASNVAVTGGELILKLPSSSSGAAISSAPYHGAGANGYALPTNAFTEARVKFQSNSSGGCVNWPAWWTTGNQWPQDGEHDIAEVLSGKLTGGNYHSGLNGTDVPNNGPAPAGSWCGSYHVYGLYRKASSAEVYWDGNLVRSYSTADTGKTQALVFNIGLSGSFPLYPGELRVDYVRAWQ